MSALSRVFCGRRGWGHCDHHRQTLSRESSRSVRRCHSDSHVDEAATTIGDAHAATHRVPARASSVAVQFHRSNRIPAGCPSSDSRPSTRTRSLSARPHAGWRAALLASPAALASATTTRPQNVSSFCDFSDISRGHIVLGEHVVRERSRD